MDTWYATNKLMLLVNDHEKKFYCPMRKNRLEKSRDTNEKFQPVRDLNDLKKNYVKVSSVTTAPPVVRVSTPFSGLLRSRNKPGEHTTNLSFITASIITG